MSRNLRIYAIALQIVAIAFGIWAGVLLFETATGSSVSFGLR